MDLEITYAPVIGETRPLREEELEELKSGGSLHAIQEVRTVHHAIARLLAAGFRGVEVSAALGVSQVTISHLKRSPAFQELLSFYLEEAKQVAFDLRGKLELLGHQAIDKMNEAFAVSEVPLDFAKDVAFASLDRLGHGPTKNVNTRTLGVRLTKEDLDQIKAAWEKSSSGFLDPRAPEEE